MTDLLLIHGLTYDHQTFDLLREHLSPGRRVLAVDLPGHGTTAQQDSYPLADVVATVHRQVTEAGLTDPVVVGHSMGGIVAQTYAARFPATAVVNIDQAVQPSPFFDVVRAAEPQLRGPGWREFWNRMLAGMGIEALPADARELVGTATTPRPDLLLGYWADILHYTDEAIASQRQEELEAIAARGIGYHWVTSRPPAGSYVQWLRSVHPEAEVTVIPGGHFPHLAEPARVAELLPA